MDPRSFARKRSVSPMLLAVQVGVGAGLIALAIFGTEARTFYAYYGLAIALVPPAVDLATGGRLTDLHRAYLVAGLSLHPLGFVFGIYYAFRWWDIVTHFVSGTMLAVAIYAVAVTARDAWEVDRLRGWRIHALALSLMVASGLVWELYEIAYAGFRIYAHVDTATDLVMNTTGWAVMATLHPYVLGNIPEGIAPRIERARELLVARSSGA